MTSQSRTELARAVAAANKRGITFGPAGLEGFVWSPLPRQQQAIDTAAYETLYGGAAGGGKSDLLLGLARSRHRSSLLLRRTFPELEDSLVLRSKEIYGDNNHYNTSKHVWTWEGRIRDITCRVRFSHLEDESSVLLHRSAAYDLIGFDEVTEFSKSQYEYMFSRARSVKPGQRVRVMACTNPGGLGNDCVMERWGPWLQPGHPHPAASGELRYFKRDEDGLEVETDALDPLGVSRTFILALLSDNPYLASDGNYQRTLSFLPEPFRSQLLNGDWQAGFLDDAYQVIPTKWIKEAQTRWTQDGGNQPLTSLGVDVARGGEDKTVLSPRHGPWFAPLRKFAGVTTPDGQSVAALVSLALAGETNVGVRIDVIGVGGSAYDICRGLGIRITGVNFSEKSLLTDRSGRLKFINKRAEDYWRFREALDPNTGDNIALPPDPELAADLRAPRWSVQSNGIKIESKDEIRSRLKRSPDCGDAVILAYSSGAGNTNVLDYYRQRHAAGELEGGKKDATQPRRP